MPSGLGLEAHRAAPEHLVGDEGDERRKAGDQNQDDEERNEKRQMRVTQREGNVGQPWRDEERNAHGRVNMAIIRLNTTMTPNGRDPPRIGARVGTNTVR